MYISHNQIWDIIPVVEHYLAMKKNYQLKHAANWMDLKDTW